MSRFVVMAAVGLLAGGPVAAAPAHAPDYVLTRTWKERGEPSRSDIVFHHAGRVRIDETSAEWKTVTSTFEARGEPWRLSVSRRGEFNPWVVLVYRDPTPRFTPASARRPTGERRVILGLPCAISRSSRRELGGTRVQAGCVTADGIELWRRDGVAEAQAIRLKRRSVKAKDVKPPLRLLDLRAWVSAGQLDERVNRAAAMRYEVILETVGLNRDAPEYRRRTVLRSGAWTSQLEEGPGRWRRSVVSNTAESVRAHYHRDPSGHSSLSVSRFRAAEQDTPRRLAEPPSVVLGVRCDWWDPNPSVVDPDLSECRSAEGIPMKVRHVDRGGSWLLVATRLERKPVPLSRILPGPELTSGKTWGIAE